MADPSVFGPLYWSLLEAAAAHAAALPPGHSMRACVVDFVRCWPAMLPCRECRDDFGTVLAASEHDAVRAGTACPLRWAHGLHAAVNRKLGAPSPTLDVVRKRKRVLRYAVENSLDLLAVTAAFLPEHGDLGALVHTVATCTRHLTESQALAPLTSTQHAWTPQSVLEQVDACLRLLHGPRAVTTATAERVRSAAGSAWIPAPAAPLQAVTRRATDMATLE